MSEDSNPARDLSPDNPGEVQVVGGKPDGAVVEFVNRSGLVPDGSVPSFEALPGGISSDIWIVRVGRTAFCVKKALPRLRVGAEWHAPVERNAIEVAWMKGVAAIMPEAVPEVLASDAALGTYAMQYLPPATYEQWKGQLSRGQVHPLTAAQIGSRLVRIHSAFARLNSAPADFSTDAIFHALRLEPYLLATARAHPDLASVFEDLAETTAGTRKTVIHGDVSPKNILVGPGGPVFLDAECAWFGDPAFDLAFCLNHLLLKTIWVPSVASDLLGAFGELSRVYLNGVDWEAPAGVEERTARLLPALLLARIDGKSPVEYITDDVSKDMVRRVACSLLVRPPRRLAEVVRAWQAKPQSIKREIRRAEGPQIARVVGRRVWDSRGRPTVEAEIFLDDGTSGRAIAPAGASTGTHEALDLRDGGRKFGGFGVDRATANINGEMAAALRGMSIGDQDEIDRRLIELDGTPNKARLGGNATVAVSMAALHAAAASQRQPLWRHLAERSEPVLPMPMIQIFGGGAHAARRVDIQDFLVMPLAASTFDEAMSITARVYEAAGQIMSDRGLLRGVADEGGWWPEFKSNVEALDTLVEAIERAELEPGKDVAIAIDVAASQFRRGDRYRLAAEGVELESDQLVELLIGWCRRYPIVSVEDPLAEDDDAGMAAFTSQMADRIQIVGDDYLVTSARRIAQASQAGACNAVLLKPNQVGTVTETLAALTAARTAGWSAIVSARSGESEDVTIVHLAVGWGVGQLKVGSFARSERTAKWNEVLRIEETLRPSMTLGRGLRLREPLWMTERT